jgi:hypothetical protein
VTPQRTMMIESVEIFRLDGSPGNAMGSGCSTSQSRIGAHELSLTFPTT